jgi:hypothetical protein
MDLTITRPVFKDKCVLFVFLYNFCSIGYFVSDKYVASYARVALKVYESLRLKRPYYYLTQLVPSECLSLRDAPSILHFSALLPHWTDGIKQILVV